jgi:hypothetical protein
VCVSDDNSAAILKQNRPLHFLWQNRQQLSVCDGRFGGGGRESLVKHRAGGGKQGGPARVGRGGDGWGAMGGERPGGGGPARTKGGGTGGEGPTGALCTGFTLVIRNIITVNSHQ